MTAPLTPPVEQTQPAYVNPPEDVSYFYNDLAPYGLGATGRRRLVLGSLVRWIINRGWSPYCDGGALVYSDCGWYWASDYSWGWAPFHYGRWQLHDRCGWVWQPDRVWVPPGYLALRGRSLWLGSVAPPCAIRHSLRPAVQRCQRGCELRFWLRPNHFTFVSMHDFADRDLGHHRLAQSEVRTVSNTTLRSELHRSKYSMVQALHGNRD